MTDLNSNIISLVDGTDFPEELFESPLLVLGRHLDEVHKALEKASSYHPLEDWAWDLHYRRRDLCRAVNVIPAKFLAELAVKTRAAGYAHRWDNQYPALFEANIKVGTFESLAMSIVEDMPKVTANYGRK